jgi:hypothetical protein
MRVSSRHRVALLALGFAGAVLSLAPARADSSSQPAAGAATGTHKEKLEFKVCRIPGLDAATSGQTIDIPAGTEYDEKHASLDNPVAMQSGTLPSYMIVVTTEAETLPANGFCVAVPAKPRGEVDEATIRASIGEMFEPNGNWKDPAVIDPISLTYGYWQTTED